MNIKTILFLCSLFYASTSFAQITVYIAPNGKVLTEETYQNGKITSLANARKNHGADYQLFEKLELVNKNGDSVKYKFRWEFMNKEMLAEKQIMGKLIGTQLSIKNLNFIDKSTQTKINYGKPTFINFWFTNCIPCIEELPALNELKEKYQDSINFVSITFDDSRKVDFFLSKHKFDFVHIIDERKLVDSLGITGYPKSFLLDKTQKIQFIEGALPSIENGSAYEQQLSLIVEKLNKLL